MSANVKINELPSGSFNAKVFDYTDSNNKRHYKSITASSKREVKRLIAEFLADREEKRISKDNITVGQAIDKYIMAKNKILSPSTIRGYTMVRKNNLQGIMNVPVSELTQQDIQAEINKESETHAPKTVKNMHALLNSALKYHTPKFHLDTTLPQKVKPDISIPTNDEMLAIFKAVKNTRLELPVYLAAMCGLRRSEIAALKWSDFDEKKETLTIRAAIVINEKAEYVEKGTKTTAGKRTIKLFTPVLQLLKDAKRQGDYITVFQKPSRISNSFSQKLATLKLPNYRFHDLRHFAVSSMLSLNMPKKYIADYMGHETERMIDEVYGHIMSEAKTDYLDMVNKHFCDFFKSNAT